MTRAGGHLPLELADLRYSGLDRELVGRAYAVAAYWHRGQRRKSGDPYVTHCVAVARILADLGMDVPTVCAGLLHDVLEDTGCPRDRMEAEFGAEITGIVEDVTRLDSWQGTSISGLLEEAEPRVLTVKLADRLHNMRTLRHVEPDRQRRKSRQTLEVFAPLADDLGFRALGRQLEDLALVTLYPGKVQPPYPRRHMKITHGVLSAMATLLPSTDRGRWLEEWAAELHSLPTGRDRARFTLQLLYGLPRLAVVLRRPTSGRPPSDPP